MANSLRHRSTGGENRRRGSRQQASDCCSAVQTRGHREATGDGREVDGPHYEGQVTLT
ncbi:MAG: hypothetical protein ACREOW_19065 [Thermodesulfobacteriota bacterium]